MQEEKDMTGFLMLETEKKSDKHPDYTGKVTVGGMTFRIAGWKRMSKSNKAYLSLQIEELKDR